MSECTSRVIRRPADNSPKDQCGNCHYCYCEEGAGTETLADCRRYPPTFWMFPVGDEDANSQFPTVYPEDWCGEYRRRHGGAA